MHAKANNERTGEVFQRIAAVIGRIVVSIFVPVITFVVLWRGFIFLRDSNAPVAVIAVVAIIWGVGGVACLYFVANWLISRLSGSWGSKLQPFLFVGPALLILGWYLFLPALRSLYLSFFSANSKVWSGSNVLSINTPVLPIASLRRSACTRSNTVSGGTPRSLAVSSSRPTMLLAI